ncbi:ABC transporter substrate-binding protein [Archaeoglobus veneficus]|uniref:Extracellular ligand-binding receptor n=1 Tax=Archaeoglobus veneficus (strain DSM 11195 / SNP6) TaxID=693661 RepID=F2KRZ2_ARCVS|nr:ABC transporter substrate-binding protein [Archaeoglobus veneficus]AEA46833.1 Extracellular ligand-binding receptor [Archaeoglobus veneficus SNP6]
MAWKRLLVLLIIALTLLPVASAEEEISIGVLVDLSGGLSTYGNDIKNTLEIAKEDINSYFEEKGLPYKVEFYPEDTKVDPNTCLQKVQTLYGRGIKLMIGPMGSGEVANIKDYVTSNKIIIISPSSTALPEIIGFTKPEEKKYIFRFVGIDNLQSKAIAGELKDLGIKGVVITYIGNAWGKGLYECIKPHLEEAGIEIGDVVEYPDQTPADFTPYISQLENGVSGLIQKYGADKVAVIAFTYEEIYTMIAQTKDDSVLFKVLWFGCDGCAKSSRIDEVCSKVSEVGMYSTLFESKGKAFDELKAKYQENGFGETPYQYALNAYDAAWVLALAYAEVVEEKGSYDADAMAEKIPEVTEKYSKGEYGVEPVSGYIKLDEWNDRASGDYAIYYVTDDCKWDTAGIWKFETDSIEWYHKPEPPVVETPAEEAPAKEETTVAEKKTPGFELVLAVTGLATVAYALRRR